MLSETGTNELLVVLLRCFEFSKQPRIALFENDVTKFCTYACWDTNADKDYIVTLIIVPLLREKT